MTVEVRRVILPGYLLKRVATSHGSFTSSIPIDPPSGSKAYFFLTS